MDYRMIVDSELLELSIPHRFIAYAESYCNGAIALTDQMTKDIEKATWSNVAVVLMLSVHSVELLLKGMLFHKDKNRNLNNTHNIEMLNNLYRVEFQDKKFSFDMPFKTDYLGMSESEIEILKQEQKFPAPSILYRYPTATGKYEWDGAYGFEASSYMLVVSQLLLDITRLKGSIT